ncbi:MAG TPA: anti-sigma factor [Actinomycetota bacterium]|jgi:anti-sigma-K factor RskA
MIAGHRPHDEIEELIAADALDGLDEGGWRELARLREEHGPHCAECLRLESEYREVASQLATVVELVPLSRGAEDALIRAARAREVERPEPGQRRLRVIAGGRRVQRMVAAVAVAAAIALLAGLAGYSVAPKPAPLATVSYRSGDQRLTIVYVKGQTQALAIGSNIPALEGGKVYELWYQPKEGANMVPAGTFVPTNGTVVAPVQLGKSFVAVAMSVEPPGGSPQPTTKPIFVTPV